MLSHTHVRCRSVLLRFFPVANLKCVILKMGNVACVSVSGACVFACHVCSCFQSFPRTHTRSSFLCVLSPHLLPVCIFGEKTNAKMDIERKLKQTFKRNCSLLHVPTSRWPQPITNHSNTHTSPICVWRLCLALLSCLDKYRVPILEPPIKSWHFLFVIIIFLSLDNCILKGHLMLQYITCLL